MSISLPWLMTARAPSPKGARLREENHLLAEKHHVGIERILNDAARSCSSSVFTFPNTMSACFRTGLEYGRNPHGPHHGAQKSTRPRVTVHDLPEIVPSPRSLPRDLRNLSGAAIIAGRLRPQRSAFRKSEIERQYPGSPEMLL